MKLAQPLEHLIDQLEKMPTIGPKTAQRLAMYVLGLSLDEAKQLAYAIVNAKAKIFPCSRCGCLTDQDPCYICQDTRRDHRVLCITGEVGDVIAIEKTGFNGRYFVLNQKSALQQDKQLEDADISRLQEKLQTEGIEEVLIALNSDIDGEITARLIAGIVAPYGVKVTRLAYGLPVGGDIEFVDELTLRRAIEGRKEF